MLLPDVSDEICNGRLSHRACDRLEGLIVSLENVPDSVMSEIALRKRLKIGRASLREAWKRSASEKLMYFLCRYQHDDDIKRSAELHARQLNSVSDGREDDAGQATDTLMDCPESSALKATGHF